MTTPIPGADSTANPPDQAQYWNGDAGTRWSQNQEALDRTLAPFGAAVLARATSMAPVAGARILDVGCGCGATTADLARAVQPGGRVTGIDVSTEMLGQAGLRVQRQALDNVTLLRADASSQPFAPEFNLLYSRFGVMFFSDPITAFANLRGALLPDGRLAFVCWRDRSENPWFQIPLSVGAPLLPPVEPAGPDEPGPFAFADPARVRNILERAGFTDIDLQPFRTPFVLSINGLEDAVHFALAAGPLARVTSTVDDDLRARVESALRVAFTPHLAPDRSIALDSATWIVTARRG